MMIYMDLPVNIVMIMMIDDDLHGFACKHSDDYDELWRFTLIYLYSFACCICNMLHSYVKLAQGHGNINNGIYIYIHI